MPYRTLILALSLGWAVLGGCGRPQESEASSLLPRILRAPQLSFLEHDLMRELQNNGVHIGVVLRPSSGPAPAPNNQWLHEHSAWSAIAATLAADLREIAATDPQAGVGIAKYSHRLFDERWLRAEHARFELVGVVSRLDRRDFTPGYCGEMRLVFRLAYRVEAPHPLYSRLPMTIIAEYRGEPASPLGCLDELARWSPPPGLSSEALGAWMRSDVGPLAPQRLAPTRLIQIAINMQSVRWPSAVRPDLGGHAEYILRAFAWDESFSHVVGHKLENTIDVETLRRRPDERQRLLSWLSDPSRLQQLDDGTLQIPAEYLAEKAISVTPRGMTRWANRPFRQLFTPDEVRTIPMLADARATGSPEALLRRLDDLSCQGCHQSRAVAGFHWLGEDGPETIAGNALASAISPHAHDEQKRRRRYADSLRARRGPDPFRPHAVRGTFDGYGAACALSVGAQSTMDPGFTTWSCAPELTCSPISAPIQDPTVGTCVPLQPQVGDACEPYRLHTNANPKRDRIVSPKQRTACGTSAVCEATSVGFPGGMCAKSCDTPSAQGTCGAIAILTAFNDCLARKHPFSSCVGQHVRPAQLRRCDDAHPCRDDYICARTSLGHGACLPPYFVFQMRVDGHP